LNVFLIIYFYDFEINYEKMKSSTIELEKFRDFDTLQQLQLSCFDKPILLTSIIQDKACFNLTINLSLIIL